MLFFLYTLTSLPVCCVFLTTFGDNDVFGNLCNVGNTFVRAIQFLLYHPVEWRVENTEKARLFVQFDMSEAFLRIDYGEVLFVVEFWEYFINCTQLVVLSTCFCKRYEG